MTGWHVNFGYLVTIQPVGTEEARKEALTRWSALPGYIDTEIANLREGIKRGYLAPKLNVRIVISQLDTLLGQADTPFLSPATRDNDSAFKQAFTALVGDQLTPAFKRYRDFLEQEYLPAARDDIAVASQPRRRPLLRRRRSRAQLARSAGQTGSRARPARSRSTRGGDADDRRAVVQDLGRQGADGTAADRSSVSLQETGRS